MLLQVWGEYGNSIWFSGNEVRDFLESLVTGPRGTQVIRLLGEDVRKAYRWFPTTPDKYAYPVVAPVSLWGMATALYSLISLLTNWWSLGFFYNELIVLSVATLWYKLLQKRRMERMDRLILRAKRCLAQMKEESANTVTPPLQLRPASKKNPRPSSKAKPRP
ncbi:hypothetical protein RKE25_22140 (plasmid) [Dyella sp. BiH032]|uniref:hypothetical protein n=1 Tax=Dyella sp. BiH032 TaxID=3075430 RepID=UPI0028929DCB|nr:hypothetical protein [Dyella sp. BiH032]WNL48432.1 hypothetical protein RKE25_22140 [Dyella sp. BiH032]